MLTPGTMTWPEAVPAFLVAVAVLFVPGTAAALAARMPLLASLAVGPVLSTSCLALAGIAAPLVGVRWGVLPLAVATGLLVGSAWLVGRLARRLEQRAWHARLFGEPPARTDDADTGQRAPSWLSTIERTPWATLVAVLTSLVAVAMALVHTSRTPEAFPQHPDTIFHVGDPLWMLETGSISSLTASGYITPTGDGFYPAAMHGVTATISLISGVPVVVATSVFVLAVAGLVWPLGCIMLARTLLGPRLPVVLATAVMCVSFTGYPFLLMGFGVLWPNMFGQALLPACLALLVSSLGSRARNLDPLGPPLVSATVLVVGVPGLALAHPNALFGLAVFGFLLVAGLVLGHAWRTRRRPVRALGWAALVVGTVLAVGAAAEAVKPGSMVGTGTRGPELPVRAALADLVLFAPRGAEYLPVLTGLVIVGSVAILFRHKGARWLWVGMVTMLGLYWLNVAVDSPFLRSFTWPWYNNAVRLQAPGIMGAAIVAAAGLVAIADVMARRFRSRHLVAAATTAGLLAAFVLGTHAYIGPHRLILDRYFHPEPANSWASDRELLSLHELSKQIPADAVTAANPWNGGTYLYVVSGRQLLVPTEKALNADDRRLLSLRLDEAGTSPEVCAAARRQHVEYAITGGQPFSWATARRVALYSGVDTVGASPAFELVATAAPYRLYRMVGCAGS